MVRSRGLEPVDGICGIHYFEIREEKEIIMRYSLFGIQRHCENLGVTLKEVADYLKVSRSTINRWIEGHDTDMLDDLYDAAEAVSSLKY